MRIHIYANYVQRKASRVGILTRNRCSPPAVSNKMLYRMMLYHVRFDADDIASEHGTQNVEGGGKGTQDRRDGTQKEIARFKAAPVERTQHRERDKGAA